MYPWMLQHFRVSLFGSGGEPVSVPDALFEALAGGEPDTDEKKAKGTIRRRTYGSPIGRFELIEQPGRIDFTRIGRENLEVSALNGEMENASLGGLDIVPDRSKDVLEIFPSCPNLHRVALAGLLYLPADNVSKSYETLQKLIPRLDLDPGRTSDLILQINRFIVSSAIPNLRINRLATYSSVGIEVQIPGQSGKYSSGNWTQVVIDINTDGHNVTPIDRASLPALLDELAGCFADMAEGIR